MRALNNPKIALQYGYKVLAFLAESIIANDAYRKRQVIVDGGTLKHEKSN